MDTTKLIKNLVIVEFVLAAIYLVLTFSLEKFLPNPLQEFLHAEVNSEWTSVDTLGFVVGVLMIIAVLAGLVGILRTKVWGKYLYLGSAAFGYLLTPTLGPTVEHAYSAAIYDLSSLAAGGAITLLLFTPSSFNKSLVEQP
jgi:hypothetical protein